MCGIAGVFAFADELPADPGLLERMCDRLAHRGPDDVGFHRGPRIGLGHRRLSIIDVAAGHQPMSNAAGTVWITYNGEIFNYIALREELIGRGYRFATNCDTEVIIAAYEAFGEACVDRLNGQFAFAIWDAARETLFLARDRMGEKPLHYAVAGGRFYFASEAKALLATGALPASVAPTSIVEVLLCNALLEGRTMFDGIVELPQGHVMTVTRTGVARPRCYWDIPPPGDAIVDEATALREFDELLHDSVKLRLMSEVPLACFLSGGLDSSLVTYWASHELGPSLQTFTLQFERQLNTDDTRYATALATQLATRHELVPLREADYYDIISDASWHLERPFEVSAPTLFLLYRAIRGKATVILTGEAADELMAGYYNTPGLGLADAFDHQDDSRVPWVSFRDQIEGLLAPDVLRETRTEERLRASIGTYLKQRASASKADQALYLFQKIFLCELLRTHDRVGMASSIESRAPFVDHRLVELLARLPLGLKVQGNVEKYLMRRSAARFSDEIAQRTKKPLPAPRGESLRRQIDTVKALVFSADSRIRQYFDEAKLRRFLHRQGEFSAVTPIVLYRVSFTLLTLEAFSRSFAR